MTQPLPKIYRAFRWLLRRLLKIFFKEIRCRGAEQMLADSGGLVIAWHPNGLIDPALIFSYFPGRIVFGARHGLFEWPILGRVFKAIGTVPIYRASDESGQSRSERFEANQKSLEALARELASGSFTALFPEGLSHDQPHLSKIRTGAARLYFQALSMKNTGEAIPVIIPVGLFYDEKNIFRSRAMVLFHDPIEIPKDILAEPADPDDKAATRERINRLTALIESTLAETSMVTENWEMYELMHRTRKLVRAERAFRSNTELTRPDIEEYEAGFSRVWAAYQIRNEDAKDRTDILVEKIKTYDSLLKMSGLEDHELSGKTRMTSPAWMALLGLQVVMLYVLVPPVLVVGYLINAIPYGILNIIDHLFSKEEKDGASIKLMVGVVLFPVFWIGTALLAVMTRHQVGALFPNTPISPVFIFWTTILFAIVGGLLALRYTELSKELFRSVRIRLTSKRRKALVDELRRNRAQIFDELIDMSTGLDLPGLVTESGRISAPEPDQT